MSKRWLSLGQVGKNEKDRWESKRVDRRKKKVKEVGEVGAIILGQLGKKHALPLDVPNGSLY